MQGRLAITFVPLQGSPENTLIAQYANCSNFLTPAQILDVYDFIKKVDPTVSCICMSHQYPYYIGPDILCAQDLRVFWTCHNRNLDSENNMEHDMLKNFLKIRGYAFM